MDPFPDVDLVPALRGRAYQRYTAAERFEAELSGWGFISVPATFRERARIGPSLLRSNRRAGKGRLPGLGDSSRSRSPEYNGSIALLVLTAGRNTEAGRTKEASLMAARAESSAGLFFTAAGVIAMTVALLFGLTTASSGPDWVGIVTGTAGLIMTGAGLFMTHRGATPHAI